MSPPTTWEITLRASIDSLASVLHLKQARPSSYRQASECTLGRQDWESCSAVVLSLSRRWRWMHIHVLLPGSGSWGVEVGSLIAGAGSQHGGSRQERSLSLDGYHSDERWSARSHPKLTDRLNVQRKAANAEPFTHTHSHKHTHTPNVLSLSFSASPPPTRTHLT